MGAACSTRPQLPVLRLAAPDHSGRLPGVMPRTFKFAAAGPGPGVGVFNEAAASASELEILDSESLA